MEGRGVKEKIAQAVELSYVQLAVIFLVLVLLKGLNVLFLPISLEIFALVLTLMAVPFLLRFKPS